MIYRAFREIIASFIKKLSSLIFSYTLGAEEMLYRAVDRETQFMIQQITDLAPDIGLKELKGYNINLPLKYNKEVIQNILSEKSIFKNGSVGYSKYDLDRMKKIILTDKYNGLSTSDIQKHLQTDLDISKRRALLIARAESQNLDSSVKEIYFKEVSSTYDLVWSALEDARETHAAMDNKKANSDGYFESSWGLIKGPQDIPQKDRWNCRCSLKLVKKDLKK